LPANDSCAAGGGLSPSSAPALPAARRQWPTTSRADAWRQRTPAAERPALDDALAHVDDLAVDVAPTL
jgi:hypothetical protein